MIDVVSNVGVDMQTDDVNNKLDEHLAVMQAKRSTMKVEAETAYTSYTAMFDSLPTFYQNMLPAPTSVCNLSKTLLANQQEEMDVVHNLKKLVSTGDGSAYKELRVKRMVLTKALQHRAAGRSRGVTDARVCTKCLVFQYFTVMLGTFGRPRPSLFDATSLGHGAKNCCKYKVYRRAVQGCLQEQVSACV